MAAVPTQPLDAQDPSCNHGAVGETVSEGAVVHGWLQAGQRVLPPGGNPAVRRVWAERRPPALAARTHAAARPSQLSFGLKTNNCGTQGLPAREGTESRGEGSTGKASRHCFCFRRGRGYMGKGAVLEMGPHHNKTKTSVWAVGASKQSALEGQGIV